MANISLTYKERVYYSLLNKKEILITKKWDDMKKIGLICMAIVVVFLLSGTALATNWVLAIRSEQTIYDIGKIRSGGYNYYYVDADSVVRSGDTISFWRLEVHDTPLPKGTSFTDNEKKRLEKWEAKLTDPLQARWVEFYSYDPAGKEIFSNPDAYKLTFIQQYNISINGKSITTAARYAKEGKIGKGMGAKPTP